jgi:hypothetical protein
MQKHFYEVQNSNSEMDEDRFQQQSNIYKSEIRYLTNNLNVLEELSISLLLSG